MADQKNQDARSPEQDQALDTLLNLIPSLLPALELAAAEAPSILTATRNQLLDAIPEHLLSSVLGLPLSGDINAWRIPLLVSIPLLSDFLPGHRSDGDSLETIIAQLPKEDMQHLPHRLLRDTLQKRLEYLKDNLQKDLPESLVAGREPRTKFRKKVVVREDGQEVSQWLPEDLDEDARKRERDAAVAIVSGQEAVGDSSGQEKDEEKEETVEDVKARNGAIRKEIPDLLLLLEDLDGGNQQILVGLRRLVAGIPLDAAQEDRCKVVQYVLSNLSEEGLAKVLCDCGRLDPASTTRRKIEEHIAVIESTPEQLEWIREKVLLWKLDESNEETAGGSQGDGGDGGGGPVKSCQLCAINAFLEGEESECSVHPVDDGNPCIQCVVDPTVEHCRLLCGNCATLVGGGVVELQECAECELRECGGGRVGDLGLGGEYESALDLSDNKFTLPRQVSDDPLANDGLDGQYLPLIPDAFRHSKYLLVNSTNELVQAFVLGRISKCETATGEQRVKREKAIREQYELFMDLWRATQRENVFNAAQQLSELAVEKLGMRPLDVPETEKQQDIAAEDEGLENTEDEEEEEEEEEL